MSPSIPEPAPGRYLDSCGTMYTALKVTKTGVWWLQKLPTGNDPELRPAYQKTDFPAAVNAQRFIYSPEQS